MDALIDHRDASRERKLSNAHSSSNLRADTCAMLIGQISALTASLAPPLTAPDGLSGEELKALAFFDNGAQAQLGREGLAHHIRHINTICAALRRLTGAGGRVEEAARKLVAEWRTAWGSPDFTGAAQNTFAHCADELEAALAGHQEQGNG